MAGKGDTPRPRSVSGDEWAMRWDQTFHKEAREGVLRLCRDLDREMQEFARKTPEVCPNDTDK